MFSNECKLNIRNKFVNFVFRQIVRQKEYEVTNDDEMYYTHKHTQWW